jgi:hypothetical protein
MHISGVMHDGGFAGWQKEMDCIDQWAVCFLIDGRNSLSEMEVRSLASAEHDALNVTHTTTIRVNSQQNQVVAL